MALADITTKIVEDAQKEAAQKMKEAEKKKKSLEAEFIEEEKKAEKKILKTGEEKALQMKKKVENLIQHQRKSRTLEEKRKILREVFQVAKEKITALSEKKKEEIYINFFESISEEKGNIFPTKGEKKAIESALKKTEKKFSISEEKPGNGGFFFFSDQTEIDFRFDVLIDRELSSSLEGELTKILFPHA